MAFFRRGLLAAAPGAALAARAIPAASAATTDLAVSCDTAVAKALVLAAAAFRARSGVRVRLYPTATGLLLPQLEREIQNDIIVTQLAALDRAEQENLVQPGGRVGPWRNRRVTASAREPAGPEGSFAVPDWSPATGIDGAAILQRLGATPAKVLGVLDTGAVAWMLVSGQARQGLVHQSDVAGDDRLKVVAAVPDDAWPPIVYAATVTKLARRGDPAAFLAFLGSPEGQAIFHTAGLESV
jgi:molybdate transport system substrate-binding protein